MENEIVRKNPKGLKVCNYVFYFLGLICFLIGLGFFVGIVITLGDSITSGSGLGEALGEAIGKLFAVILMAIPCGIGAFLAGFFGALDILFSILVLVKKKKADVAAIAFILPDLLFIGCAIALLVTILISVLGGSSAA